MNSVQLPVVAQHAIEPREIKNPVALYEEGCEALELCSTIAEAKYWDRTADTLAAWAKINKSQRASVASRRLKLKAYRCMGELAAELQPSGNRMVNGRCSGSVPGPVSLLKESGLSKGAANAARKLALISEEKFGELVRQPRPPTPIAVRQSCSGSDEWRSMHLVQGPWGFRSFCRRHDAATLARGLTPDEAKKAGVMAQEITDWLDEFDRHLKVS